MPHYTKSLHDDFCMHAWRNDVTNFYSDMDYCIYLFPKYW